MPTVTPAAAVSRKTLLEVVPEEAARMLFHWAQERRLPPYRARQAHRRLWVAPVAAWTDATELPLSLREELQSRFPLPRLELQTEQVSRDGTRKFLWRLPDMEAIETVLIPAQSRHTLCISSQAGCALGCRFCATGQMGFRRNLSAFEIAGQLREVALRHPRERPTNVVFMGMGEPLLNWPSVDQALTILNDAGGCGVGARHITVSTVGILPSLAEFARRPEQFRLAISLHAPTSERRKALMPIEKKYDLAAVLAAAAAFKRRVTFEYVLIAGANDSDRDADALAKIARPLGALVNLLPLHPGGAPNLTPTPADQIRRFADRLKNQGIEAVVRRSRGLDISAACGQLRVEVEERRRAAPRQVPS